MDFVYDKIEALNGYPKAEFDARRKKWLVVVLNEDMPGMQQRLVEALKANKSYIRKVPHRNKNGNTL